MNWSDCESAWKRQPLPVGEKADVAELRATFENKRRKLAAMLQLRDWSEIVAAAIVIAAYAYFWKQFGAGGWPMIFAMLLVAGVAGFFLRERLRVRRLRLGAEAPLLAKVEADLAELRHQHRLLREVGKWYLAPCVGAMAIHLGVIIGRGQSALPRDPLVLAAAAVVLLLALGIIWGTCRLVLYLNRQALVKNVEPRLVELEKLRSDLTATASE